MAITKEMLEELLKDYHGPDDLMAEDGLLKQLTKALVERAMGAELSEHLGYEKHEPGDKPSENRRMGRVPRRFAATKDRSRWRCRGTEPGRSSRRSSASTSGSCPGSATRFCRCTREG